MNNATASARRWHFALTGLLLTVAGVAQAEPVLQLTTTPGLQAGPVRDGTLLMRAASAATRRMAASGCGAPHMRRVAAQPAAC
ncbi:hypothetical protein [Pantoea agglomerans]|uniref:Uncharacterized protein n=1 Tax=Enterobacter agglomerans TaxID=549 RepID=A0ABD6XLI4_ENTAG